MATTHWAHVKECAARFPKVLPDPDPIWLRDGNFYTSAGLAAGLDLALALAEKDLGSKVALAVARQLVLFLRRPGGQSQFIRLLEAQEPDEYLRAHEVLRVSSSRALFRAKFRIVPQHRPVTSVAVGTSTRSRVAG